MNYHFRYYSMGNTKSSVDALRNIKQFILDNQLKNVKLEEFNLTEFIEQSKEDGVFAAPALIRLSPDPDAQLIGNFLEEDKLKKIFLIE